MMKDEDYDHEGETSSKWIPEDDDDVSCITECSGAPLSDIQEPGPNDVITRPQGEENYHIGNRRFTSYMNKYTELYRKTPQKQDKFMVAVGLVKAWRSLEPTGRFLIRQQQQQQQQPQDSTIQSQTHHSSLVLLWEDVGDQEARTWAETQLAGRIHHHEHEDDSTASTTCSSFEYLGRHPAHRFEKAKAKHEPPGVADCFGGSLRAAFMTLFSIRGRKDGILQQYLP